MKFFDLYAGIGGFRLAMESLGHEYIGSCEIDFYARETYKKGFGKYPQWNDATKLDPKELPDFDCLCAGFPCQAFSVAGQRGGFADTRGTLFFEIIRIAREKRPKLLFLENVKGLLSHDKGRTFETMLNALDEVGYDAEWQVINGKYFLPQNRERIFIIGHLRGAGERKIFPLGESDELDNRAQEEESGSGEGVRGNYSTTIDSSYYKGHQGSGTLIQVGNIDQAGNNSLWGRVYDPEGIASTLNAEGGGLGAKTGLYMTSHTKANIKQRHQERDTTWTLDTNGNKMAIADKKRIRKLTPRECERLQGFPDDWTKGVSDTQRYKQVGNAVMVPCVRYVASHF